MSLTTNSQDATPGVDHNSTPDNPMIFCHLLDGKGGSHQPDWQEIAGGLPPERPFWLHLDRTHPDCRDWATRILKLEPTVIDELFDEETRPHCIVTEQGVRLNLRGLNLNQGADPTDMLALRFWITEHGVITLRRFHMRSARTVHEALLTGHGPSRPGGVVAALAEQLMELMLPLFRRLDDILEDAELQLVKAPGSTLPANVPGVRADLIELRRYLRPQADALRDLIAARQPMFNQPNLSKLGNALHDVTRFVEDLDEMRERAIFIYDELQKRQSEQLNQTMYRLTLITVIFLPLGFVTGLLGINVGGIPGSDNHDAFWVVTGLLALLAAGVYGLFHWRGYLGRS